MHTPVKKAGQKIWSVVRTIFLILLSVILLFNLYFLISGMVTGDKHPAVFGYSSAIVLSGSMEPELSVYDMIVTKAEDHYEVGDVIMFRSSDRSFVTHRVSEILDDGSYRTKGDANNTADLNSTSDARVAGKVVWVIPQIGRVFTALQTPLGMMCLIVAGGLLIIFPSAVDWIAAKKQGKTEPDQNDKV